jgi:cell division protein FtsL
MATKRRIRHEYVYGNTARAVEPQRYYEEPQRYIEEPQRRRRTIAEDNKLRKNQEKALQVDLPYVLVLTLAVACVLSICVNYLHVQASISGRIHNIETLESKLETLKAENDALETRINTNLDLDRVYKIATQDLGMVYANRNQVILYDKTESEYVRQYEDIPKH